MALRSASRHPFLDSLNILVMLAALVATSLWALPRAYAAHEEGVFELEGDIADDPASGDDWANVYAGTSSADVSVFVDDGTDTPGGAIPLDTTYFQGGNTKDIDDISSWKHTDNSTPDKNEIEHAFAAAYQDGGDVLVYFGLDRYAVDGDAQVGFWFLQGQLGLNPDGTFAGSHEVGDVLVLSDFTNGGTVNQIDIYEWVGTGGDTNGTLDLLDSATECDTEEQNGCAIVNTAPLSSPWPYDAKGDPGFDDDLPVGAFFEGGINLTELFDGEGLGCFTTFLAETRSSQEPTAVLKDFALGSFDLCSFEATLDADALGKITDPVTYTVTVTNTGQRELWLDSVTLSVSGDTYGIGDADTNDCPDPLPAGANCELIFTRTVVEGDADPLGATVDVVMDEAATLDGIELSDSDDAETELFQPSVDVTKTGTMTSLVGDEVAWTITIENTSSGDAPDLVFDSIDDTLAGDLMGTLAEGYEVTSDTCGATLASGASCEITYVYTVQDDDPDPLANTVEVHLHPDGFPNDITDSDSHDVDLFTLGLEITKTGDTLSKIGDPVTYTFTVTNTSSDDAPDLLLGSLSDDRLGDLTAYDTYDTACDTLAPGDVCSFDVTVDVPETDDDPYVNVVTAAYGVDGFEGFGIQATDDHSLNLFQAALTVEKDGPALAQVGDEVTYSFTITNTSSDDAPSLVFDEDGYVIDDVLGDLTPDASAAGCDDLASGESCSFDVAYTIQGGDADPLVNVVDVMMHPDGFPNEIVGTDSHSTDLIGPNIALVKTVDPTLVIWDADGTPPTVTYTYEVTNTGDVTLTDLVLDDDRLGPITLDVGTLAPGGSTTATADHTVTEAEADEGAILNVAIVTGTAPDDSTVSAVDDARVDIVEVLPSNPDIALVKTALIDADDDGLKTVTYDADDAAGNMVEYEYLITNTGDVTLTDITLVDDVLGDIVLPKTTLEPGESMTATATHLVTGADADEGQIVNVAEVTGFAPGGGVKATDDETVYVVEVLQLALTGIDADIAGMLAAGLLALGGVLLLLGRKRPEDL